MSDELTRLPDRKDFRRELTSFVEHARQHNTTLALFSIKLLYLHEINTTFGYQSGDELLTGIGTRIRTMLNEGDMLYRIGDSSFALLLPNLKNENIAGLAANKLLSLLEPPFSTQQKNISASVKMGVALWPQHADDAEALLHFSDIALEEALLGSEPYQLFHADWSDSTTNALAITQDMHDALDKDEFFMRYQPQFDLQGRCFSGMEALVRWQSAKRGLVPPYHFIPLLEKSPLIVPFTLWTVNAALRRCAWLAEHGLQVPVSVNLSASALNTPELAEHVLRGMRIWGIEPGQLILEVTESALMEEPEQSLKTLRAMHEAGILLSIDDFGTGYSSLAYLSRLPVSELKIDKTFVMKMTHSSDDFKIVHSIIELAHNFGLKVIAEGIEDEQTLAALIELGCDRGQGYYFARPMAPEDLLSLSPKAPAQKR